MLKILAISALLLNVLPCGAQPLFQKLSPGQSGVLFENKLVESPEQNIITYEYFYNGGGVAAGDFNNDGLVDLYFTSNQQPNKLYINKGNLQFEDVTKQARVEGYRGWKTGVSVADVNGDGWLDIYVCYSGDVPQENRKNQLFVNNGNLTFSERAEEYGLADFGHTTMAAFFDYDRDGDLDCYVLNHNVRNLRNFDAAYVKQMRDPDAGDRLYRNDNGKFIDVSAEAGIISNPLGYGLGVSVNDVNNDGWPDIYICNDYVEEDYFYINNKAGGFTNQLKQQFGHISNFSMGVDVADVNNDGLSDILTLDMLPADNRRQKLIYAPDNFELYENQVENGFYHQLMRNMLQVNNGNGSFSEVGQAAGINATDWSWSALLFDLNNDGHKDLFVSNGYGRDMINRDFMKFYANERLKHLQGKTDSRMFLMLQGIQSTPLHNYVFQNTGGWNFTDRSESWGFTELDFSHGAAVADLDNDGDLDIIVNRMNAPAALYINQTNPSQKPLTFHLKGAKKNPNAIGARVTAFAKEQKYTMQQYPVHGFQSSMQIPLSLAVSAASIDSVEVRWPGGGFTSLKKEELRGNIISLNEPAAAALSISTPREKLVFKKAPSALNYAHKEVAVNDFKTQPLLPNMLSYSGPRSATADLNNDGLTDVLICGAKGQPAALYLQTKSNTFTRSPQTAFEADANYEDCAAVFFDADGDGDKDLYIVSGGYSVTDSLLLQDRLYINNAGNFTKASKSLPAEFLSGSCVVALDFDNDGDLDIFCGSRCAPGKYPLPHPSLLLQNDGKGNFSGVNNGGVSAILNTGLVTDVAWENVTGDSGRELIIASDYAPIRCFKFLKGQWSELKTNVFPQFIKGWWNRMKFADLDKDGDLDLIAGNWGNNSAIHATVNHPATMYAGDFDSNGFVDPLLFYYIGDSLRPMASRDELTDQMVSYRQRFPTYDSYADAGVGTILSDSQQQQATQYNLTEVRSCWFENVNGSFEQRQLPAEASYAPVYAIEVDDFNRDGISDIVLGGNVFATRIKVGRMDANYGVMLAGDGHGGFKYLPQHKSGLDVRGCVRDLVAINNGLLLFFLNDAPAEAWRF